MLLQERQHYKLPQTCLDCIACTHVVLGAITNNTVRNSGSQSINQCQDALLIWQLRGAASQTHGTHGNTPRLPTGLTAMAAVGDVRPQSTLFSTGTKTARGRRIVEAVLVCQQLLLIRSAMLVHIQIQATTMAVASTQHDVWQYQLTESHISSWGWFTPCARQMACFWQEAYICLGTLFCLLSPVFY